VLWLPFGKLFHVFQRPAQLGVSFYKDAVRLRGESCRRCGAAFAPRMMVRDLIDVERQLGFAYELPHGTVTISRSVRNAAARCSDWPRELVATIRRRPRDHQTWYVSAPVRDDRAAGLSTSVEAGSAGQDALLLLPASSAASSSRSATTK
jgi:hypothetical protein